MAQHRTKQDKIKARIHRIENTKLYSLSELETSSSITTTNPIEKIRKPVTSFGINMNTVKSDLKRTGLSLGIVLVLLALGFFFLK